MEVAYHAGTYGMGGPGFFGLLLTASLRAPEEWLLCTLWGAGSWMIVDGRWLLAHPEQYAQKKPLYGTIYERSVYGWLNATDEIWDEFRPRVIGQTLRSFVCERQSRELLIGQSTLQITKDAGTRPIFYGSKRLRCLTWRHDLRRAWVLANTAAIRC